MFAWTLTRTDSPWDHLSFHNDHYHDFGYEEDQGWADVIYWGDRIPYDEGRLTHPAQPEPTQELQIDSGLLNRDEPRTSLSLYSWVAANILSPGEDETANQNADAAEQSGSEAPSTVSKSDSEISPVSPLVHNETIDTTEAVATTSEGLRQRVMELLPMLHGYGSHWTEEDECRDSTGVSDSEEDQSEEDSETERVEKPPYNPFSLARWNSAAPLPQPAVFYPLVELTPLPPFPTFPQPLGAVPSLSTATGAPGQSALPVLTEDEEHTFGMFLEEIDGQRGDARVDRPSWYVDGADKDDEDGESKEDDRPVESPSKASRGKKRCRSPDDCEEDEGRPSQVLRTR